MVSEIKAGLEKKIGLCQYDYQSKTYHANDDLYLLFDITAKYGRNGFLQCFRRILPDDRKRFVKAIKKSRSGLPDITVRFRIRRRSGEISTLSIQMVPECRDTHETVQITGVVLDVTEHDALKQKVHVLSSVVQQSPSMIGISDTGGNIIHANPAFLSATGFSLDEIINKNFNILKSGHHEEEFYRELWRTIQNGGVWRGEFINKKKSGEIYNSGAHIFPIFDESGEIVNFVATEKDITEKKRNDLLKAMEGKLFQMGETISMIAHQWRQPLNSVSIIAGLIKLNLDGEKPDLPEIYEFSEKIDEQVQFLSRTINDFRNLFNPNKSKEHFMVSQLLNEVLQVTDRSLAGRHIQLFTRIEEDYELHSFKNELIQVLINLIKNAEDVLEERNIEKPYIRVLISGSEGKKIIEVSDNAGGIPDSIITKIFDPYFSTKDTKVGTGLGLYMSRVIVQEHCDGELNAVNTDAGAKFTIELKG